MTAIAKSAKRHPAAKKFCGWEEPAISVVVIVVGILVVYVVVDPRNLHLKFGQNWISNS